MQKKKNNTKYSWRYYFTGSANPLTSPQARACRKHVAKGHTYADVPVQAEQIHCSETAPLAHAYGQPLSGPLSLCVCVCVRV